jgi:hypothetical protein
MSRLNEYQRQTTLSGFRDAHHRLADMEAILAQSLIESPFFQYIYDLSPTERKVIQDYFGRIREAMRTLLHDASIRLIFSARARNARRATVLKPAAG